MSLHQGSHQSEMLPFVGRPADEEAGGGAQGDTLEDAARDEREFVRERLRRDLQRDPTDEEVNDYLRRHTEGY